MAEYESRELERNACLRIGPIVLVVLEKLVTW
jgi:hypothetical protein